MPASSERRRVQDTPGPLAFGNLRLQQRGKDEFVEAQADDDEGLPALFGGRLLAQALRAAGLTRRGQHQYPNSMHVQFLQAGQPGVPVSYQVERIRDGRSFANRVVIARQQSRAILTASVSFHVFEEAEVWPETVPPLPLAVDCPAMPPGLVRPMQGFDLLAPHGLSEAGWVRHPFWIKTRESPGDDLMVHACLLAYISDMGHVWGSRGRGTGGMDSFTLASLDHALWFHRPVRADDWLWVDVRPIVNYGGRGFGIGEIRDQQGILLASVAQESLQRPPAGS